MIFTVTYAARRLKWAHMKALILKEALKSL